MAKAKVWAFFYGSYMDFDVLKGVNLFPEKYETAKLNGFDIKIQPLANLIRSDQHCVYGIVMTATHEELRRLYEHAQDTLGGYFQPEAVLIETLKGKWMPALCYISHSMIPNPAKNDYIDHIVNPSEKFGFPHWYIQRLNSFRPQER